MREHTFNKILKYLFFILLFIILLLIVRCNVYSEKFPTFYNRQDYSCSLRYSDFSSVQKADCNGHSNIEFMDTVVMQSNQDNFISAQKDIKDPRFLSIICAGLSAGFAIALIIVLLLTKH
ncbi:MAG: hypothetical protein LBU60_04355 [Clostridiales bacterium]|nr:hypothetical protein [Clostridiales bacterium]